ncbi:glycosyltransferase family 2 protein [Frondihabitans australicus]|uniref:Glycosyl transferase family 2 n=1 Tax=Frondihabitans australicus TaxID=386892 RepID=A0A495IAA0_9MICO|nr:glycosyltransferase family 2 protein [Frondihabitans australicus]RKR72939.1 glycosyl transferase family 2 [Frondihabitans australicus]
MTRATLTIAVLTYRRPDDLGAVLPLLASQAVAAAAADYDTRVLVVDNDPGASARDQVAAFAATAEAATAGSTPAGATVAYAHEPEPGIAAARNRALEASAESDLLVFIDDDERPSDKWLVTLLDAFEIEGPAAVVGPVVSDYSVEPDPWIVAGRFFDRRRLPTGTEVDVAATNNLLLDLRLMRSWGLEFERSLGTIGRSDTVFTRSIVRHGGRMIWCDEAVVTDVVPPHRLTRQWVVQRAFSSGNGWSLTSLLLAPGRGLRLPLRLRLTGKGLVRLAGGGARVVVGSVARSMGQRARGVRTIARGAGMVSGAWGHRYQEYRRSA